MSIRKFKDINTDTRFIESMLFHVTMIHTADNCPGYYPDKMADIAAAAAKMEESANQLNIKIHFILSGAPEHIVYALVEADSLTAVSSLIMGIPIRQEVKVTPVVPMKEEIEAIMARLSKQQK